MRTSIAVSMAAAALFVVLVACGVREGYSDKEDSSETGSTDVGHTGADSGDSGSLPTIPDGALSGNLELSEADLILTGRHNIMAGKSVALVGDVDGDGFDDLLVGARDYYPEDEEGNHPTGAAYLVYGSATISGTWVLDDAGVVFVGESPYAFVGRSVTGVDDVNADGYADFVISSSRAELAGFRREEEPELEGYLTEEELNTPSSAQLVYGRAERYSGVILCGLDILAYRVRIRLEISAVLNRIGTANTRAA